MFRFAERNDFNKHHLAGSLASRDFSAFGTRPASGAAKLVGDLHADYIGELVYTVGGKAIGQGRGDK